QAAVPEGEVAEVRAEQERAPARGRVELLDDLEEVVEGLGLVVVDADGVGAARPAEFEQERGDVVCQGAVVDAALEECVTDEQVGDERGAHAGESAGGEDGVERSWVVEDGIESFFAQAFLFTVTSAAVTAGEETEDEVRFRATERGANVRQDHGASSSGHAPPRPDAEQPS